SLDMSIRIFNDYTLLALGEQLIHLYGETELDPYPLQENLGCFTRDSHEDPVADFIIYIRNYLEYYSVLSLETSHVKLRSLGDNRNGDNLIHENWVKNTALVSFLREWRIDQHFIRELISTDEVKGPLGFYFS
ncbi:MAG: hypothetical protein ACTSP4_14610, partial [Candidatus Hodarchaeales archaeon]